MSILGRLEYSGRARRDAKLTVRAENVASYINDAIPSQTAGMLPLKQSRMTSNTYTYGVSAISGFSVVTAMTACGMRPRQEANHIKE